MNRRKEKIGIIIKTHETRSETNIPLVVVSELKGNGKKLIIYYWRKLLKNLQLSIVKERRNLI